MKQRSQKRVHDKNDNHFRTRAKSMYSTILTKLGRRLRLGMVGGGFDSVIGETHRIAYQTDGYYELVAGAFSIDQEISRATGAGLLVSPDRIYDDYRDMARREAARKDGIDVVVIATPPQIHKDVAMAFLNAGIDVICEKPLTKTVAEAQELAACVASSGRLFVLTHCYSGFPMVRHARDLVRSGALGRLRMIEVEFAGGAPGVSVEPEDPAQRHWRFRAASMGKEAVLGEVGSHAYHLMSYITGMLPQRLSARMQTLAARREVYDNAYLDFDYKDGVVGRLWASYVATGSQHGLSFRIYGDKAALEWREENAEYLHFRPLQAPEMILRSGQDGTSDFVARSSRFRPGHPEGYPLAFANIYAEAALALVAARTDTSSSDYMGNLPSIADGVAGMRMIAAATASNLNDGDWHPL
ncbi:Gfo/Idh/MocA family protein [Pseudomonas sp. Ma2-10]